MERLRLRKMNKSFARLQQNFRARQILDSKRRERQMANDELRFQLLLEHRRKQRQRKVDMIELLEILPPDQIGKYFEKQRDYSARIIQANYRGYRQRKLFNQQREEIRENRAAICIQRQVGYLLLNWYRILC